jgi:DNA-directed RNA polymerase specialized sigma24 family protein
MPPDSPDPRLSQISTLWSTVEKARGQRAEAVTSARQRLIQRYGGAVQRYLLGALRNAEAADELTQEFALRFMDGKYQGADRDRGRFRNFVKGVLAHLIADHYRRLQARPPVQPLEVENVAGREPEPADPDPLFVETWRQTLLSRAWKALAELEEESGKPFHTVLRLRVDQPDLRSAEMAEHLSAQLGKPISAAGIRQTLHRARDRFAELLLDEVDQTLETATEQDLEQELIELNLLKYCKEVLGRRFGAKNHPADAANSDEDSAS